MIEYRAFKDGKRRIVTFSYDDGAKQDIRLLELFNKYGVKGTFNLNGHNYVGKSEEELNEIRKRYEGHEIACHTLNHCWPGKMPAQSVIKETYEDRLSLEKLALYPVCGMAYPSGSTSDTAIEAMKSCGIVYSRTTIPNPNFSFPDNFMRWNPTCHDKNSAEPAQRFINNIDSEWTSELFYIWGHSHEFVTEDDWARIENLLQLLTQYKDKIWFATNMEIYRYLEAQKNLIISADEKTFINPSSIDVWIKVNRDIIKVPAGQRVDI